MNVLRLGQKVRITKRRTGVAKGNPYTILSIINNKAKLQGANTAPDRWFQLRDLS